MWYCTRHLCECSFKGCVYLSWNGEEPENKYLPDCLVVLRFE